MRRYPGAWRFEACRVVVLNAIVAGISGCTPNGTPPSAVRPPPDATERREAVESPAFTEMDAYADVRRRMVENDLRRRDIVDRNVLAAMGRVPRHRFVPDSLRDSAYADHPLPIGHEQTISQPYIVALMSQLAAPTPGDKALDIGTGSGYQAAVLAELCERVFSMEIVEPLARDARARIHELGYKNVEVRHGDGYRGWPEHAPFDVIIVAAAPDHVPDPLVEQLAPGGRMVIPVGSGFQNLMLITKSPAGDVERREITAVRFVPMTGEARRSR